MTDFRLGTVPSSSVLHMYSMRDAIWFDPPYQRMSDVWPMEKRQLLIDSILNGYDLPKLYFHEFFPAKVIEGRKFKYAIVDGKQRLQTIFSFIEGKFALARDLEIIDDAETLPGGMTYAELARNFPALKTKLDGFVLPIVTILTPDTELIEDMFSRLNEAVPLNAAEKRNALGGPVPPTIRRIVQHEFFVSKLPFENRRYRHFDLAAKFLYVSDREQIVDTKKVHLDNFVISHREQLDRIDELFRSTAAVLEDMSRVFIDSDPMLRSVGSVLLYYYLFFDARRDGWTHQIQRNALIAFDQRRTMNRAAAENGAATTDYHLLEFDRLSQSPNDAVALKFRYAVLRSQIGPVEGRPEIDGD